MSKQKGLDSLVEYSIVPGETEYTMGRKNLALGAKDGTAATWTSYWVKQKQEHPIYATWAFINEDQTLPITLHKCALPQLRT